MSEAMDVDQMYEELAKLPTGLLEAISRAIIYPDFARNLSRLAAEAHQKERDELFKAARSWMWEHAEAHREGRTREINCTKLAEGAAAACGLDAELDDETSPIWEIALEIAEAKGGIR